MEVFEVGPDETAAMARGAFGDVHVDRGDSEGLIQESSPVRVHGRDVFHHECDVRVRERLLECCHDASHGGYEARSRSQEAERLALPCSAEVLAWEPGGDEEDDFLEELDFHEGLEVVD